MKRVVVIIAILVAAAACGGTVGEGTSRAYSGPQQSNGSAVGAPTKISGQPGGGAGNSGNPSNPSNPSSTDSLVPPLAGPPVIRQAQLGITVSSGAFDSKLSELRSIVEVAGGYIAGTDAQVPPSDSQIRTGVINFMVPAAQFDSVLDQLAKVGKLQNEHITGVEVGSQYVDLRARLANAEAQRNAMLTLLAQAKTISDIIAVQNQIGQITVQMEQLKGQKRDKAIVTPRQVAMFLMRAETDVSLLRIGAELGGRDHSTVLHACDKITRESAVNDELRREIAAVRELIYAD